MFNHGGLRTAYLSRIEALHCGTAVEIQSGYEIRARFSIKVRGPSTTSLIHGVVVIKFSVSIVIAVVIVIYV